MSITASSRDSPVKSHHSRSPSRSQTISIDSGWEHIEDANAFFRALYNHLTPGGVYLGLTVNARHGFAIITRTLRALGLDEVALQIVRRRETGYHYPVRYRANGMAQLRRIALEVGFDAPSFITLEADETIGYFKGPLKLLYWLMQWKRSVLRRPGSLLTLIVRLEKPNV